MQVAGKVFVVTGGGAGIGRDVVLELLSRQARVAAVDLRPDFLAGTERLAGSGSDRLTTHTVDVTDREAVGRLAQHVLGTHGQVDGLLNVAGVIQHFVPFAQLDHREMERVVAVNLWGVVNTTEAFLPLLLTRAEASLLNVSSMGALVPVPGQTVYGASKAAVRLLTDGLYAELHGGPVAVTCVFPGAVATDIAAHSGVAVPSTAGARRGRARATTSPEAARQIVAAVEAGTFRVCVGRDARALDVLSRVAPRRAVELVARRMRSLLDRREASGKTTETPDARS